MAQRTFDGVTLTGAHFVLTAPANGTVKDLIDSAVRQTWNMFELKGLYHKGHKLEANTKLTNVPGLQNGDQIALAPKMSRMGMNPNNMRAAKQTLETFFSQPRRGGKSRKARKSKKSRKAKQTRRR